MSNVLLYRALSVVLQRKSHVLSAWWMTSREASTCQDEVETSDSPTVLAGSELVTTAGWRRDSRRSSDD